MSSKADEQRAMTSMRVFREFIKRGTNRDGSELVDATEVISRECYDLWISTRKTLPPNPEKAFQRSLSAHVTGVDAQEEEAVLRILRKKERWPCFEQSSTRFGLMGFRAKGFHEKSSGDSSSAGSNDLPQAPQRKRAKHYEDDDGDDDDEEDEEEGNHDQARHKRPSQRRAPLTAMVSVNQLPRFQTAPMAPPPQQFISLPNMSIPSSMMSMGGPQPMILRDDFSMPAYMQEVSIPQQPPGTDSGYSFLETAGSLLNRFYVAGVDAWGTVLSIARMFLVSSGWTKPPTMEDANRILQDYNIKYPGSHVIVFDPTTRQLKDRVMCLSLSAQQYLGPIARTQQGLDHRLIPLSDAWSALTTATAASKAPGVEFHTAINIVCVDGVLRPVMASFCMFPGERILVTRAVPRGNVPTL